MHQNNVTFFFLSCNDPQIYNFLCKHKVNQLVQDNIGEISAMSCSPPSLFSFGFGLMSSFQGRCNTRKLVDDTTSIICMLKTQMSDLKSILTWMTFEAIRSIKTLTSINTIIVLHCIPFRTLVVLTIRIPLVTTLKANKKSLNAP